MIRRTKVLMVLLLFSRTTGFSQQLSHQVLVPAAGLTTVGVISYSQTIGETAVELIGNAGFELTQGFQQPRIVILPDIPPAGTGVDVYPNPATDFINVKLFGEEARNFRIDIINFTGMIVSSMTLEFITKYYYIQQIEVTRLTIGIYLVRVSSDDGKINRIFKIEKM
jgi:hypothetical protein